MGQGSEHWVKHQALTSTGFEFKLRVGEGKELYSIAFSTAPAALQGSAAHLQLTRPHWWAWSGKAKSQV